jgi:hypothetical protein
MLDQSSSVASTLGASPSFSVFISHSMKDADHVEQVRRQLDALGIQAWLAEFDPRPGTSVLEKIESMLPKCDAVVFLITTNSIDSAYVQQEVGLARAHGIPMVPLVDKRVDTSRLGLLSELEWIGIDLQEPSEALMQVTKSLQPLLLRQTRQAATPERNSGAVSGDRESDFDPALTLLLVALGIAVGLLLISYTIKIEIGPS